MKAAIPTALLSTTLLFALGGCAPQPVINADSATSQISPADASADPSRASGTVVWGGVIVASENLADRTQLEVLGYPLDSRQRPRLDAEPIGRFLIQSADYLETLDYAPGRAVTVLGSVQGVIAGQAGASRYNFPTVTASTLHLWRGGADNRGGFPANVHFGIGISL